MRTILFLVSFIFVATSTDAQTAQLVSPQHIQAVEREAVLMGTDISFVILTAKKQSAEQAIDAALQEMKRIEDMMTDWRSSKLTELNEAAGKHPVKLPKELIMLLQESKKISQLTEGAFDITYAALNDLWRFHRAQQQLPSSAAITKKLPLVNYKQLVINPTKQTAYLTKPDMKVGLGGIAKGYAVDRAVKIIKDAGFINFAVNAGGDLSARGRKEGQLWRVSIRHPRDKKKNIAILPISNTSVVTSGDNERYFMHQGKRYAHILNPKTGWPAKQCQSVSIMAKPAYRADALATGVFVLGPKRGLALIESLPQVEGMIVDATGHITVSSGLKKKPSL